MKRNIYSLGCILGRIFHYLPMINNIIFAVIQVIVIQFFSRLHVHSTLGNKMPASAL